MADSEKKEKGKLRDLTGFPGLVVSTLALAMALFQFYTAFEGSLTPMIQRGIHLAFGLSLILLVYPATRHASRKRLPYHDAFLAGLTIFAMIYAMVHFTEASPFRMVAPTTADKAFGIIAIALVLEVCRRSTGNALPLVTLCFLAYAFLGEYAPGPFAHGGVKLKSLITYNYMTLDGIFGVPTGSSAKTIFVIVIFGVAMLHLGGGDFFIQASSALFGRLKGGPAKIAVIASALFGTITGTGPANVAATGVFTIPLMKKSGYEPSFAGAVEAVASSGGQIMPPVMGVAAFIMADMLNITYLQVCLAALIPALLYFFSVYMMVHLEALKLGLKEMPDSRLGSIYRLVLGGWTYVLPVLVLVFMIAYYETSPERSGFWAMVLLLVLEIGKQLKSNRSIEVRKILKAVEAGVISALVICAIVASVGIIMSVINLTGIGLKLGSILISYSHGIPILLLLITMMASLILGMGMSTVACYIILAILAAPALVSMGIDPVAAHLFVLYFGIISAITPPVALSSFVAASIADSPPMKTAWKSFKLGLASFILPYMFVYGPSLLMKGSALEILRSSVTAIIGVSALSISIEGVFFDSQALKIFPRLLCFTGAFLLIHPGILTDGLGFALVFIALARRTFILVTGRSRTLPPNLEGTTMERR